MKIGYIYLFGEEWEEWKKHNRPLPVIIDELKELGCDKIYMDVFIEDDGLQEIERIDMGELVEKIIGSPEKDELIVRGTLGKKTINEEEIEAICIKEVERIHNRHHRQI